MTDMGQRLQQARRAAGFETIRDAVDAFGWKYPTYAGHENGHRNFKALDARKYADAFEVSEAWLLTGKGQIHPAPAMSEPQDMGFRETQVAHFSARSDTERQKLLALAKVLAPNARHISLMQAKRSVPGLMIMEGDILLVDLNPAPSAGQVVIVQVFSDESGEAETRLAVWQNNKPSAIYGEAQIDGNAPLRGTVISVIRPDVR